MTRRPDPGAWRTSPVREVMRENVVTIDAHAPAREALRLLADNSISGMPVTDGAGGVVGVISMRDVIEYLAEQPGDGIEVEDVTSLVGDAEEEEETAPDGEPRQRWFARMVDDADAEVMSLMNPELVTVRADATLVDAARAMVSHGVHRVIVRDGRKFVGLITATDVLRLVVGE